jgi:hypothetical protein
MKSLKVSFLILISTLMASPSFSQSGGDNQVLQAIVDRTYSCANNATKGNIASCGVTMYGDIVSQVPDRNLAKGPSLTLARRLTEIFSQIDRGQISTENEKQIALMGVMDQFRNDLQAARDNDRQRTLQMFRDAERILTPPRQNTIECLTNGPMTRCKY